MIGTNLKFSAILNRTEICFNRNTVRINRKGLIFENKSSGTQN